LPTRSGTDSDFPASAADKNLPSTLHLVDLIAEAEELSVRFAELYQQISTRVDPSAARDLLRNECRLDIEKV
jgi:hypothetical protein